MLSKLLRNSGLLDTRLFPVISVRLTDSSTIEHKWSKLWPHIHVIPVLAKNVGRVLLSTDVVESQDLGSNRFSNTMVAKRRASLVQDG